jgi:6-pyruvoyltetrahydropterin/6-carboxytetrahydropterin synthase
MHGHNYVLDVTAEGIVDPATSMVINIKAIDALLQERIVSVFAQKSINDDVPGFDQMAPSGENILMFVRSRLQDLPIPVVRLRLQETPDLSVTWDNHLPDRMTVTRLYEFAASHRLHEPALSEAENLDLFGKCTNPGGHGHNYVLEVSVSGEPQPPTSMVVRIEDLDAVVEREIVDRYDHKNLNVDVPELVGRNPTSEVVALTIFERLEPLVPGRLESVVLHETARNRFEVRR